MRHCLLFVSVLIVLSVSLVGPVHAAKLVVNGTGTSVPCEAGDSYYSTIASAITAATSNADTVVICPNGTSHYNEALTITKNLTIYGNQTTGKPIINRTSGLFSTITLSGTDYVNISRLTLASVVRYGFYLTNANHTNATDLNVTNSAMGGIYFDGSANNKITNSTIAYNAGIGITVVYGADNNTFANNTINNNTQTGLRIASKYNNITDNTLAYNAIDGIYVSEEYNNITNNRIYGNIEEGLHLEFAGNYNSIYGNNISNNSKSGIFLETSASHNIVTNNEVYNNSFYGIDVFTSSNNNTLTNNRVYRNGWSGVIFDGSSNSAALGNEIYNNTVNGIRITSGSNNNLTNNNISNNGLHGIFIDRGSRNNIFNNTMKNNTLSGIFLNNSANNTFWFNNITSNIEWDFNSTSDSQNNTVINNFIGPYNISFMGFDIAIKSNTSNPAGPLNYIALNKTFNITNTTASSWIHLNITYVEEDIGAADESSLRIWRHDGATWSRLSGTNGVDTVNNYVFANITNFSTFAAFGALPVLPQSQIPGGSSSGGTSFKKKDFSLTTVDNFTKILAGKSGVVTLSLENTGEVALTFSPINITGIDSSWLTLPNMPMLNPGLSTLLDIKINPLLDAEPKTYLATATVTSGSISRSASFSIEVGALIEEEKPSPPKWNKSLDRIKTDLTKLWWLLLLILLVYSFIGYILYSRRRTKILPVLIRRATYKL